MTTSRHWPRAIVHIDMNAFFASVESRDFPELRGRPIGVTNGAVGTTLITCSYEARARGVRTGMRIYEARTLCPDLIQRPARPRVYAEISTRIMRALTRLSPDVEVFSVDEAFIDVTHCQRLHGTPERMAHMARTLVHEASGGLPCSVGVAGNKSTAKLASELKKPNGFIVIPPWEARARLQDVPMQRIGGLGPRIAAFLSRYGARTCGDVARLPLTVLERHFGVTGKYLWLACQGEDTEPVQRETAAPKSVGHGKVLPPRTTGRETVETYLRHMCEKVAARLRRYGLRAGRLYVGVRCDVQGRTSPLRGGEPRTVASARMRTTAGMQEVGQRRSSCREATPELGDSLGATYALSRAMPDGRHFFMHARRFLDRHWHGEAVTHVQVTATALESRDGQMELFAPADVRTCRRASAVDHINRKYGEFAVAPATLLARSTMPNVIAPAWRPDGLRQHIPG